MPVDKFGNEIKQRGTAVKSDEGISLSFANKTYIRLDGESDITGNLNMALRKIENLGEPTNPKDATSKEYVDNTKGSGVIGEIQDETATIKGNLDFTEQYRIKNLPVPVDEKDAVSKEYVNSRDESLKTELLAKDAFEFKDNEYQAKQDLYLKGFKIHGTGTPFHDGDVVTKGYVESVSAPLLKLDEGKYKTKGDIDMSDTYTICNIKAPVDDKHITDKKYVDDAINLNSAFTFRNGGYYAKGGIYLRKNRIGGLREPTQDGEPATKKYVDDTTKNLFIDENDNIAFGLNVDMEGNKIFSLPEPEQDNEAATKKYVDDLQTQHVDEKGNVKFGRNINLDNRRIFAMKEPKKDYEGANKKYVDDTITKRIQEEKDNFLPQDPATKHYVDEAIRGIAGGDVLVSKEGVFIKENGHYRATAPLDIDNQKVENLPDPVDEKDAVNKKYVDDVVKSLTLEEALIKENGGYNIAEGYINMNFNNIKNLGNPKNETDAVPKKYVDNQVVSVKESINKRKQLIVASASYHADLIKGDYQFTWSGQSMSSYKKHDMFNGFLVPSSGYIKKIVVLSTGIKMNTPEDREILDFIVYDIGYNNHIPLFTLVLIRQSQNPVDIGTLYFYFTDYGLGETGKRDEVFKFNPNFEEKTLRTVGEKDIINIRSEFNRIKLDEGRIVSLSPNYNINFKIDTDFMTYLVSILIELDPLDEDDDNN